MTSIRTEMDKNFGKMIKVNLREHFKNETTDFTPWLIDHIQDISNLLGIEISDLQNEKGVGDFRLDIMGKESRTNTIVAIENQLGETDHSHLGQLLTYTAGLGAGIVIWISPSIRPEHEATLEWLNEKTDCRFFGIEISLKRIGDSKVAPDYLVKVKPTTWTEEIKKKKAEFSPRNQAYQEFFRELILRFNKDSSHKIKINPLAQSWNSFGAGKSGFWFDWAFTGGKQFGVELYIGTPDTNKNKEYFDTIKAETSTDLKDVQWDRLEGKKASKVAVYTNGDIDSIQTEAAEREKLIEWGIESMDTFVKHFSPVIRKLK